MKLFTLFTTDERGARTCARRAPAHRDRRQASGQSPGVGRQGRARSRQGRRGRAEEEGRIAWWTVGTGLPHAQESAARRGGGARHARARDGRCAVRSARRPLATGETRGSPAIFQSRADPLLLDAAFLVPRTRARVVSGAAARESRALARHGYGAHRDRPVAAVFIRPGLTMARLPKRVLQPTVSAQVLGGAGYDGARPARQSAEQGVMLNGDVTLGVARHRPHLPAVVDAPVRRRPHLRRALSAGGRGQKRRSRSRRRAPAQATLVKSKSARGRQGAQASRAEAQSRRGDGGQRRQLRCAQGRDRAADEDANRRAAPQRAGARAKGGAPLRWNPEPRRCRNRSFSSC